MNLGIEVLLDDREERPGVKFNDSELMGLPVQIVIGKHAEEGLVEYKERNQKDKQILPVDEAISRFKTSKFV